jgi:predicted CXXCH cytochrome family protein
VRFRGPCLLLVALLLPAGTSWAGIAGSPHDLTILIGDPFRSVCSTCHTPHKAQGERLWLSAVGGPATGWGSRPIAQLCYFCHDSAGGGMGASNMIPHAFSTRAHGYDVKKLPLSPDGEPGVLPALPYVASGLIDCTTCHDPHSSYPPFLRELTVDQLCKGCHGRENTGVLGASNVFLAGTGTIGFSLHPTDIPYVDTGGNGPTSLRDFPQELQVPTAQGSWRLGGHRVGWQAGAGNISCQTCHAVHGWKEYPQGRPAGIAATDLTAIENGGGPSSPLCEACHGGGAPGGTVGKGDDHAIDRNDGTPVTVFPAGWPAGPAREVVCSTCHDVHGGLPGTSLLRRGGNAGGWCWSCHERSAIVPDYHHSTKGNDDAAVFSSILTCEDCHGSAAGWTAHNGFSAKKIGVEPGRSALCEICHVAANPLAFDPAAYEKATGVVRTFAGAVQPAAHGVVAGKSSHLIDKPDDNSVTNCQIKRTPWASTGAVSKYGAAGEVICESCHGMLVNAGTLLGSSAAERRTGGWRANLLVEPYEDNSPGVGVEKPDNFVGPTLSGLCRGCHYSVLPGVDPSFVHNPSAHTADPYTYPAEFSPYGRATLTVLTTPNDSNGPECPEVSTADKLGAPGRLSYPMANRLDCDSCHRPHGAHDDSADDGIQRILEYTGPGAHGTIICYECHDTEVQCNK